MTLRCESSGILASWLPIPAASGTKLANPLSYATQVRPKIGSLSRVGMRHPRMAVPHKAESQCKVRLSSPYRFEATDGKE